MMELKEYVDGLFRHQYLTPELKDLKEEILSNMTAKRDDLLEQGIDAELAAEMAKKSLTSIDSLVDGNQLTDLGKYRFECAQTLLLHCILFWIFSLPLLLTAHALISYLGLLLTVISGGICLWQGRRPAEGAAFLSVSASRRRGKMAWLIWIVFFAVFTGMMAALTFGSHIWFGRPIRIDGPYQMMNVGVRFYLPLLTIVIPVTFSSFTRNLRKCSVQEGRDE